MILRVREFIIGFAELICAHNYGFIFFLALHEWCTTLMMRSSRCLVLLLLVGLPWLAIPITGRCAVTFELKMVMP